jgi:hypothetical protein
VPGVDPDALDSGLFGPASSKHRHFNLLPKPKAIDRPFDDSLGTATSRVSLSDEGDADWRDRSITHHGSDLW